MEQEITQPNARLQKSSQADAIAIPDEKQQAMGDVLDRIRINQGWLPYDDDTQDAAIQSWVAELDANDVPYQAYSELYSRAVRIRAIALQAGKQAPVFGVEVLIAAWIGEQGLEREWAARMRERLVSEGRTLGDDPHRGMQEHECISPLEGLEIVRQYLANRKTEKANSAD